jgi:hypothetical protein
MKLRERVIGMGGFKSIPDRLGVLRDLPQARNHQIVLRAEVTIQRHLVGASHVGDRIDTDRADPVLAKQIPGRADDALSRPWQNGGAVLHQRFLHLEKNSIPPLDPGVTGL